MFSEKIRPRPEPRVAAFFDSIADKGIGPAVHHRVEILGGIRRLVPGRRPDGLSKRYLDFLDELFEDQFVGWSLAGDHACARFMEDKRKRGGALEDCVPDAFLAAAAATRGLAVVTRSTSDFRNTGVETVASRTAALR